MQNQVIKINGMSCGHCVMAVEKSIKKLPGIEDVKVQLAEGLATVYYDESKVSLDAIAESIEEAGYSVVK
jgi:copper chaperone